MFLLSLLDPTALSELSLPRRLRPPQPLSPDDIDAAIFRALRALQQALAQRKLTIEPEERKMARAFMASIVPPHAGLLYEEVNERLNEATRNLLSHMVAARKVYAMCRALQYTHAAADEASVDAE